MEIDPASLNRAMYGNARLDTIQKMVSALGVTLFGSLDNDEVEGYIKIKGKSTNLMIKKNCLTC